MIEGIKVSTRVVAPPPPPGTRPGSDSPRRARARRRLIDVLWTPTGQRRLPRERELVAAMQACTADDVWWVCEASSAGPVYLLPTREWVRILARWLDATRARVVVEVAAGDGFLAACLRKARPQLRVIATDNHAWTDARARQSARDRRQFRGVPFAGIQPGDDVMRMSATAAVKKFRPDVVIVSWPPPGSLVARVIGAKKKRARVLEITTDGDVCGSTKSWRFDKEFLDDTPLATRALCRLDDGRSARRTRVTLY